MFRRNIKPTLEDENAPKVKPIAQLLRGFKDHLPKDALYWNFALRTAERACEERGYVRMDVPHLEEKKLFVRGIGKETDVVSKELFEFEDRDGNAVALRPEFTAGIARAYIEHGFWNMPQPVRVYAAGSAFRYERPQAGRLREHTQVSIEAIGDQHPVIDAEIMHLAVQFFRSLGIDAIARINSIGCQECRTPFREALTEHAKKRKKELCENCQKRLLKNPLRILDCKEEGCQVVREGAPQMVDALCDACREHFVSVLEYCDTLQISYELDPYLVRGLDYYTKTVFEFYTIRAVDGAEKRIALGGGGRYDDLVAMLGGRPTPAAGMALGVERVIAELKARGINPPNPYAPRVFIAQLGKAGREKALLLAETFRKAGVPIATSFSKDGLKAQLELANKLNVALTLILGQKEVLDGTVMLREMEGGIQEVVPQEKIVKEVERKLAEVEASGIKTPITNTPVLSEDGDDFVDREHGRARDGRPDADTEKEVNTE